MSARDQGQQCANMSAISSGHYSSRFAVHTPAARMQKRDVSRRSSLLVALLPKSRCGEDHVGVGGSVSILGGMQVEPFISCLDIWT